MKIMILLSNMWSCCHDCEWPNPVPKSCWHLIETISYFNDFVASDIDTTFKVQTWQGEHHKTIKVNDDTCITWIKITTKASNNKNNISTMYNADTIYILIRENNTNERQRKDRNKWTKRQYKNKMKHLSLSFVT